ncbi:hypothetical protein PIB30_095045, partial [Stylosanthes scabra]|nr:hypothetical protein [Stylosanthes scabra]
RIGLASADTPRQKKTRETFNPSTMLISYDTTKSRSLLIEDRTRITVNLKDIHRRLHPNQTFKVASQIGMETGQAAYQGP